MAQSNAFTFSFVEQTGGALDIRTRAAVRSHAAKETRRRRRVQQQKRQQELNSAEDPVSRQLLQPSPENSSQEYSQSSSKRQRSNMLWWLSMNDTNGSGQNFPPPLSNSMSAIFDPFASMVELSPLLSSSYSKDLNVIKSHAIDFCFPGPTKTVVFPEALRTPALLGSILYMAYANLSSLRGWSNPELALVLKTAAISHVNKKLSHPSTATCTNVIASIAYLSTGTWIFGDEPQETATHLTGIQLMVRKRGMKSLGVYRFGQTIQKYLFIQHAVMQAISAQPSQDIFHFDYALDNGAQESTASIPQTNLTSLCSVFMAMSNCPTANKEMTSMLLSTKSFIESLLALYEGCEPSVQEEETFGVELYSQKAEIQSHLSASDPNSPSFGDYTYECVRLSSLLIIEAIEMRVPLNKASELLATSLSSAIAKTDLSGTWGEMLGVLYWVSMIGAAAWKGRGGKGERMMDSVLGSAMFKATFEPGDLGSAIAPVRMFGRFQIALERRCKIVMKII